MKKNVIRFLIYLGGMILMGLGTGLYESPRNVDATRDMPLTEGMVLSIGPAVAPGGKDPYRCTDAFVVTAQGARRLSRTPRTLREL